MFEELRIPSIITGTAVGLISLIGYMPDIFFNSLAGRIIDASPNKAGFDHLFLLLIGCAILGLLVTILLSWNNRKIVNNSIN